MDEKRHGPAGSASSFQKFLRQAGPAIAASYTLIGALFLLGGGGFFLDRWLETGTVFTFAGLVLGLLVGLYEIAKIALKKPNQ